MARVEIGQTVINGDLRWWRAGSADDGRAFEEDAKGIPPEDIRRRLIEKEGEWQLIANNPVDQSLLVRVVRSALELDISAAAKLLRQLPGVIYTGTKVETAWLKAKLHEVGETAEIRRSK